MKCLLCNIENDNDEVLKDQYINFHSIEKDNYFFKKLFTPDFDNKYSKRCMECGALIHVEKERIIVFYCIVNYWAGH